MYYHNSALLVNMRKAILMTKKISWNKVLNCVQIEEEVRRVESPHTYCIWCTYGRLDTALTTKGSKF